MNKIIITIRNIHGEQKLRLLDAFLFFYEKRSDPDTVNISVTYQLEENKFPGKSPNVVYRRKYQNVAYRSFLTDISMNPMTVRYTKYKEVGQEIKSGLYTRTRHAAIDRQIINTWFILDGGSFIDLQFSGPMALHCEVQYEFEILPKPMV